MPSLGAGGGLELSLQQAALLWAEGWEGLGEGVGGGEGMAVLKLPPRFPTWSSNSVD